jgi:GTPase SAR1 family protein
MGQASKATDRIEAVRAGAMAILEKLLEKARTFELPESPAALAEYRTKLAENTYQVLVVGEAKRGKSTFVNALIGRDLLPTDVDVATSQVFRISQAEREAYRLRFEDGSEQPITPADLPRYGSQVLADAEGVPRLDEVIRWIEVDVPLRFLARGVSLLDTPGLGALYAGHAQITHRFVPHADAVIFVLDSERPIGHDELNFVETLLGVTRNLFFIQTKIDLFRSEHWQEVRRRNQDILRDRFAHRLPDARVWPISSTNLRKAAQTGDEDYLIVSRHRELAAALQTFLFRVAGWARSAEAVLAGDHYHATAAQWLAGRQGALVEESQQQRAELQRRLQQRKQQFDADWSERGQKRRELLDGVRKAATLAKTRMRQALQSGGPVEAAQLARINASAAVAELSQLGQTLGGDIVAAACEEWRQAREQVRAQSLALLQPFLTDAEALLRSASADPSAAALATSSCPEFQTDWVNVMRSVASAVGMVSTFSAALGYLRAASGATGLLSYLGGASVGAATAASATTVATVAAIPVVIWLGFRGWKVGREAQLKNARQELQKYLTDVLRRVWQYFLDVDQASGRSSLVEDYFEALERNTSEQLRKLAAQKSEEAQAEQARLEEDARLGDRERKARSEQLQAQLAEWQGIGPSLREVAAGLRELDRALAPPGPVRA